MWWVSIQLLSYIPSLRDLGFGYLVIVPGVHCLSPSLGPLQSPETGDGSVGVVWPDQGHIRLKEGYLLEKSPVPPSSGSQTAACLSYQASGCLLSVCF